MTAIAAAPSTLPTRHPAGTSAGGRFAAGVRGHAVLALERCPEQRPELSLDSVFPGAEAETERLIAAKYAAANVMTRLEIMLVDKPVAPHADTEAARLADHTEMIGWARRLVEDFPSAWLPEVEADPETGDYIESLADLAHPYCADGACAVTSDCIEDYLYGKGAVEPVAWAETVEGGQSDRGTDGHGFGNHYALLVRMRPDSNPLIVDYTYRQFDPTSPFPLVASPQDWAVRVDADTHRLNDLERRRAALGISEADWINEM